MSAINVNTLRCRECSHIADCILFGLGEELSQVVRFLQLIRCEVKRPSRYTDIPVIPGYYIVCEGKGMVITTIPEGKRLVTQILKAGDGLMVSPHWSEGRYNTFIRAFERTVIRFIRESDLLELQRQYPSIGLRLLKKFDQQVCLLREKLIDVAYAGTKARVAALILELKEVGLLEEVRFSQEELAEMVGISREMLNRRLKELAKRGLVALKGHRIHLLEPEALARIAKGVANTGQNLRPSGRLFANRGAMLG